MPSNKPPRETPRSSPPIIQDRSARTERGGRGLIRRGRGYEGTAHAWVLLSQGHEVPRQRLHSSPQTKAEHSSFLCSTLNIGAACMRVGFWGGTQPPSLNSA